MLNCQADQPCDPVVSLEPFVRNDQLGSLFFSKIYKDASGITSIGILSVRLGDIPVDISVFLQNLLNHGSLIGVVHDPYLPSSA